MNVKPRYRDVIAIVACLVGILGKTILGAQCIPGNFANPGFYTPDGESVSSASSIEISYSDTITWISPESKEVFVRGEPVEAPVLSFRIDSIHGLPPGFSYTCNNGSCIWQTSNTTAGCFTLDGNPGLVLNDVYNLTIYHTFWISVNGLPLEAHKEDNSISICVSNTSNLAGPDQVLCSETSTNLMAQTYFYGRSGWWTRVSGTGEILWPESPNAMVIDIEEGENVFQWTTAEGFCGSASDQVVILKLPRILNLTGNIPDGTYCAVDSIISDGMVASPDSVVFKAGLHIGLEPQFEVETGAKFETIIEECQSSN